MFLFAFSSIFHFLFALHFNSLNVFSDFSFSTANNHYTYDYNGRTQIYSDIHNCYLVGCYNIWLFVTFALFWFDFFACLKQSKILSGKPLRYQAAFVWYVSQTSSVNQTLGRTIISSLGFCYFSATTNLLLFSVYIVGLIQLGFGLLVRQNKQF